MRIKMKPNFLLSVIILFLCSSCFDFFYEKERISIDLKNKKVEIIGYGIYPTGSNEKDTLNDSLREKAWNDLKAFVSNLNVQIDTTAPHYHVVNSGTLFVDSLKKLNLRWIQKFTCDTLSDTADWLDWDAFASLFRGGNFIIHNNDEILYPLETLSDDSIPVTDSTHKLETPFPVVKTKKNQFIYFPDSTRSISYEYSYNLGKKEYDDYFVRRFREEKLDKKKKKKNKRRKK